MNSLNKVDSEMNTVTAAHKQFLSFKAQSGMSEFSALSPEIAAASQLIWDYHVVSGGALPADVDVICCIGSNDLRVAERAAEIYSALRATTLPYEKKVLFSGGVGALTKGLFGDVSEAEAFARVAESSGVPRDVMLIEGASTNTGENARFSSATLASAGIFPKTVLIVTKPFMERRAIATFEAQWPVAPGERAPRFHVTSPQIPLAFYADPARGLPLAAVLAVAVGDLQRIALYPPKGFQTYQHIPEVVWKALQFLIRSGFGSHAIRVPGAASDSIDLADYEGLTGDCPCQKP